MLLDILCSCSLEQPTETPTDFTRHFVAMFTSTTNREASIISLDILCLYSLELPTEKPTSFTWHFVVVFTWIANRETDIFCLTFCGHVYLNHLQINQHISPDILFLYSLELPTEKNNIFYLTFCGHYYLNKLQRSQHILLDILFIMFT